MNIIDTKPVGRIILNEQTPERKKRVEHYLIPYYQRGYRWDEGNVTALLEDIHNFSPTDKEAKYCLQPIVVVPSKDKDGLNIWEVIDGQQRLITLYIIFRVISKPRYNIIFEKRDRSNDFLEGLEEGNYSNENPDFHFMSQAHKICKQWFDEKSRNDVGYIDDFNAKLTKKVELIWYQVEELANLENSDEAERKKIDIFNRLNIGKIPLTDAELIRALLLSKVKYGLGDREAVLRQSELSAEWHRIEQALRDEHFWYFLNKQSISEISSTIEFIFKLMAKSSSKKYSTYLWFEKEIKAEDPNEERDKASALWQRVKEYFGKLKHWYEDDFLYHHLGFKLVTEDNSLTTVKNIIDNANCSKSAFRDWAVKEVQRKMKDVVLDDLNYEKNPGQLKQVFLLHNILLSFNRNGNSRTNRFAFDEYKKIEKVGGWSLEHIHAQFSKEMKEEAAIRKWLDETYSEIKDLKETDVPEHDGDIIWGVEELIMSVSAMRHAEHIDIDEFNRLKIQIVKKFDSGSIHVLDNLALLATKHNSALNNGIFAVKRRKIIEMDKEGKFIPPATRNVFLKYYSPTDLQPFFWSKADKEYYVENIKVTLKPYLTFVI